MYYYYLYYDKVGENKWKINMNWTILEYLLLNVNKHFEMGQIVIKVRSTAATLKMCTNF
jgi:hypothetical protein